MAGSVQLPAVLLEWDASAEGAPGDRATGAQDGHGHGYRVPAASKGLPAATPHCIPPTPACTHLTTIPALLPSWPESPPMSPYTDGQGGEGRAQVPFSPTGGGAEAAMPWLCPGDWPRRQRLGQAPSAAVATGPRPAQEAPGAPAADGCEPVGRRRTALPAPAARRGTHSRCFPGPLWDVGQGQAGGMG